MYDIVKNAIKGAIEDSFGNLQNVDVRINKTAGSIAIFKKLHVVDVVTDHFNDIALSNAIKLDSAAEIGGYVFEPFPPVEFSHSMIEKIRTAITDEILAREKENEYSHFSKLKGTIISGIVKKPYLGGLLIGIDKFEAYISKRNLLPGEVSSLKPGARVNAIIYDVVQEKNKPQAYLTRTSEEFLLELLKQDISEIYEGIVSIKSLTRDAGSRSKIAVASNDPNVDPVAICIGAKARKIAGIMKELNGEKIDFIRWSNNPIEFLTNALKGIKVDSVTMSETSKTMDAVIPEDGISLAIGRDGQNARLVSRLIGMPVHFMTQEESSNKKIVQFEETSKLLTESLGVEEIISQILVMDGLDSITKIALAETSRIASIEGFNAEIAEAIQSRAKTLYEETLQLEKQKNDEIENSAHELANSIAISQEVALAFAKAGLATLQQIADCSLIEIIEDYSEINVEDEMISLILDKAKKKIYG